MFFAVVLVITVVCFAFCLQKNESSFNIEGIVNCLTRFCSFWFCKGRNEANKTSKQTNKRTKERMRKRTNEHTREQANERSELTNERAS